jgi:predicted nucleic acid-binding Zn ribbon protein
VSDDGVTPEQGLSGPELARAALDAARARRPSRRRPADSGSGTTGAQGAPERRTVRGRDWSGAGPDPRDPQPLSAVIGNLLRARGWEQPTAEARVFAMWEQVVGADVAAHCRPTKLEGGELTVEAASTAWATQLRLLAGKLLKQIAAQVGHNVVTRMRIHGPAAPSWNRGPRRVRGRGPRDTYG